MSAKKLKNYAIILASGSGSRFGKELPKQFIKVNGKTIFEHTICVFEKSEYIDSIIVVVSEEYLDYAKNIVDKNFKKVIKLLKGGKTRTQSSYRGISAVEEAEANVIIHDCARPLLSDKLLTSCIDALKEHKAVAPGIPVTDTIWEVDNNGFIKNIPQRTNYRMAQTPQCFRLSLIKQAYRTISENEIYTDDCSLILKKRLDKIFVIEGDISNIKITYPKDLCIVESMLSD